MVPLAVGVLARLPLTPNGKTDRRALPPVARSRGDQELFVAPRTPVETGIAELWQQLLGVPRVGVHDVFLDLGGHSLLAAGLLARIERAYGTRVPLAEFFAAPTVAALAVRVAKGAAAVRPSPRPCGRPRCPPAPPASSASSGCTSRWSPAVRSTTCRCASAPSARWTVSPSAGR